MAHRAHRSEERYRVFADLERRATGLRPSRSATSAATPIAVGHALPWFVPPEFYDTDGFGMTPAVGGPRTVARDCIERKSFSREGGRLPSRASFPLWVVCHERRMGCLRRATVREMKEGPSGSAIRSRIPSHRKLLWSKVTVVSVAETPGR